ncbi:MAG: class I adenylate-forming enzyme family protein [Xanthomonadales bacterium]|nr:class I adenylate-forming enzyme family protein [Xanthomonadales bacterium]
MINEVVRAAAARWGDHPGLIEPDGRKTSVAGLEQFAAHRAAELKHRGIGRGDVVALCLPSGREYYTSALALARLGAVVAGINPLLAPAERASMIDAVGAGRVLATHDAAEGIPDDVEVHEVVASGGARDGLLGRRPPRATEIPPPVALAPDEPCVIVFTSGSTGRPKGATFTSRQLAAALEVERADPWSAGNAILSGTQFPHVGFMLRFPGYLEMATTLVLLGRWSAGDALDVIGRHRMPAVNGVAAQLALMLREPDIGERDFSHVKRIVTGGGPATPALIEEVTATFGAPFTSRYSLTEAGGVGTATALDGDLEERAYTVGRPRPGVSLRIAGVVGERGEGEVGEIQLRGPAVMSGYWGSPEASREVLEDGWLSTGDLGCLDDRGLLRLAGRTNEMYVRGGYNVYPQEVEAVLNAHPGVASINIVPRPDDVMGQIGVAAVIPRDDRQRPTLEDLRAHGLGRLARYKLPEAVSYLDEFPVTAMNKTDRRALTSRIGEPDGVDEFLHPGPDREVRR